MARKHRRECHCEDCLSRIKDGYHGRLAAVLNRLGARASEGRVTVRQAIAGLESFEADEVACCLPHEETEERCPLTDQEIRAKFDELERRIVAECEAVC